MTATRLVGFEAAAIRHADDMNDTDLALFLSARIEYVINTLSVPDNDTPDRLRAQDLRELAAAALITARRMDAR